jgi:dTDP-4-dehydrorhamnose 3,5-epimerase
MSEFYHPESARGLRWDDPTFGTEWPVPIILISNKGKSYAFTNKKTNSSGFIIKPE